MANGRTPAAPAGSGYDLTRLASSHPVPDRFGIGRPAMAEEIHALDIDVMPDGRGLPPGSGTAAAGAPIYAQRCASCHGPEGKSTAHTAPLVGRTADGGFAFAESYPGEPRTIGSYWPYATTLFDYIRRAMPFDRPGTLSDPEVYAVTAWLLWKNGLIEEGAVMNAETLPRVVMPARERFVRDDRETSTRVR